MSGESTTGNTATQARRPSTAKRDQPRNQMRNRASKSVTTPAPEVAASPASPASKPLTLTQMRKEAAFWDQHFPLIGPHEEHPENEAKQQDAHVAMTHALAAQLKGSKAWAKLVKDSGTTGYTVKAMPEYGLKGYTYNASEQLIDQMISDWGDDVSAALHLAVREEFGIATDHMVGGGRVASDPQTRQYAEQAMRDYGPALRAFMRANYNVTQAWFKQHGITEVTLYRGRKWAEGKQPPNMNFAMKPEHHPAQLSPLASFTTNPETARMFTHTFGPSAYRAIIMTRVPVKDILAMPLTGLGRIDEQEMLVLGGTTRPSASVSWKQSEHGDSDLKTLLPLLARAGRLKGGGGGGRKGGSKGSGKSGKIVIPSGDMSGAPTPTPTLTPTPTPAKEAKATGTTARVRARARTGSAPPA